MTSASMSRAESNVEESKGKGFAADAGGRHARDSERVSEGSDPLPPRARHVHIPALDGIRGLAILLVLLFHFHMQDSAHGSIRGAVLRLAGAGWTGVDLFFVLSGFLITSILWEAKHTAGYFRNFYMRRLLRIFPLYYAALLLGLVLVPALTRGPIGWSPISNQWALWVYLSNYFPARPSGLIQFWSLAVEEQFYLVWPAVVFLLGRRMLIGLCGVMIVAALAFRISRLLMGDSIANEYALYHWNELTYFATYCRMDTLAVGALLALMTHGSKGIVGLVPSAKVVSGLAGIGLATIYVLNGTSFHYLDPLVQTAGFSLLALFFGGVLVLAVAMPTGSIGGKIFDNPILRFFGKYSYGIYVIHGLVHPWLDIWSWTRGPAPAGTGALLMMEFRRVGFGLLLSIGLAVLSWHLFEKHFLKLKRFFEYRTVTLEKPVERA